MIYRTVVCVPSGRKRNLEILVPYLLRDRDYINEVHFWLNTNNAEDVQYINDLAKLHPNYFKLILPPDLERKLPRPSWASGVDRFYIHCTDPDTIYIKCDDDICYIEKGAIENLIKFRIEHRSPLLIYPNIVNNVMLSHLHQRFGCIPMTVGICKWDPFCDVGHKSGKAAGAIHESFLKSYKSGGVDSFKFPMFVLWEYVRVSIGFILFFGEDFAAFGGIVEDEDDEAFLSVALPAKLGRPNIIYGQKLVCHFSYGTQRTYLEADTNLLARYKDIMHLEIKNTQEQTSHSISLR
jgi:hypothetical protein